MPVANLSGGNQQKVIIARELHGAIALLVVAQPTRGLDVGSIEFIHRRIIEMRDQGAAVLLVSAELDEILNLSDRIGVIYRGALVGTFDRADATRDELGLLMASGHDAARRPRDRIRRPTVRRRRAGSAELRALVRRCSPCSSRLRRSSSRSSSAAGVILLVGDNPFEAYWALLRGMFGCPIASTRSLGRSTPFIGAALAVAFAFRAGLFNIGAEGQLLVGATAAAWVGTFSFLADVPGPIAIPIVIAGRRVGGGLWGGIPGVLKATHRRPRGDHHDHAQQHRGADRALDGQLAGPVILRDMSASVPRTAPIPDVRPPPRARRQQPAAAPRVLHHAVGLCVVVWFILRRTTFGFEVKTVGANPNAAKYAGMGVERHDHRGDGAVRRLRRPGRRR